MQIQNIDENLSMNISDTSGVSLQVSDVDTSLEMNIDTNKDVVNLNIINEEGNVNMEVESVPSKIEGTTDHSKLQNLDYEHSGHTGFASKNDIPNVSNFITKESDPTVPQHVKEIKQEDIKNWNNKPNKDDIPDVQILTGGDNAVIENNKINVYTNTGYKVSDNDIQLQTITETEEGTQEPKLVYTDTEIELIYDGTNKIRRSENGIDFEVIKLSAVCKSMLYIPYNKRLIGLYDIGFIYSDDIGKTWEVKESSLVSGNSYLFINRYNTDSFLLINKTNKTISVVLESFVQNSRITSSIVPEFITTLNDTQYIWCNSVGTFKYGVGSKEGNFASISGAVNMLRTVNNKPMIGLKNSNKMYIIKATNQITGNEWVEYKLPDTCTVNDIIFNPNDETYYIFTDINTYYKTKDLTNPDSFESVDKNGLRGIQGYFTLEGIQLTTSNHNELLLCPARTKAENMIQLFKRETNKNRWVGPGLERVGEEQIGVKDSDTIAVYESGVSVRGGSLDFFYFTPELTKQLKIALAPETVLSPLEIEGWYWSTWDGTDEWYYNVMFTEAGSFYDFWSYTEEYIVEKAEKGYIYTDADMSMATYTSKAKYGALFQ